MNQFLPLVLNVDAHGRTGYGNISADVQHWWRTARLAELPYLHPRIHLVKPLPDAVNHRRSL